MLLHVTLSSTNRSGLARLTHDECKKVFEAGYATWDASRTQRRLTHAQLSPRSPLPLSTLCRYKAHAASAESDGIGLDTVAKAAKAASGNAWLHTKDGSDDDAVETVFHVALPAAVLPDGHPGSPIRRMSALSGLSLSGTPAAPGLSAAAASAPPPEPRPEAAASSSAAAGTSSGTDDVTAALDARALVCIGIDDDRFVREVPHTSHIAYKQAMTWSIWCLTSHPPRRPHLR